MKKKINLGMYSDDTRKMFIQYEGDKFYVMHQDFEGMNEVAQNTRLNRLLRRISL